jgi:hypothetical protein
MMNMESGLRFGGLASVVLQQHGSMVDAHFVAL